MIEIEPGPFACRNTTKTLQAAKVYSVDRDAAAITAVPYTCTGTIAIASYTIKAKAKGNARSPVLAMIPSCW